MEEVHKQMSDRAKWLMKILFNTNISLNRDEKRFLMFYTKYINIISNKNDI